MKKYLHTLYEMKNLFEHSWSQDESKRNSKSILISKILTYNSKYFIYFIYFPLREKIIASRNQNEKIFARPVQNEESLHPWSQDESKRNSNRF